MNKGWLLAFACLVSLPVNAEEAASSEKAATEVAPVENTLASKAENIAPLEKARAFVDTYTSKHRTFDGSVADLYSDKAVITQNQIDNKGKSTQVTLVTAKYKEMLRTQLPKQKVDNTTIEFTNVEVKPEGDAFRANGMVHSSLKPVKRPFSLLVKQLDNGGWQIIEESATMFTP